MTPRRIGSSREEVCQAVADLPAPSRVGWRVLVAGGRWAWSCPPVLRHHRELRQLHRSVQLVLARRNNLACVMRSPSQSSPNAGHHVKFGHA